MLHAAVAAIVACLLLTGNGCWHECVASGWHRPFLAGGMGVCVVQRVLGACNRLHDGLWHCRQQLLWSMSEVVDDSQSVQTDEFWEPWRLAYIYTPSVDGT